MSNIETTIGDLRKFISGNLTDSDFNEFIHCLGSPRPRYFYEKPAPIAFDYKIDCLGEPVLLEVQWSPGNSLRYIDPSNEHWGSELHPARLGFSEFVAPDRLFELWKRIPGSPKTQTLVAAIANDKRLTRRYLAEFMAPEIGPYDVDPTCKVVRKPRFGAEGRGILVGTVGDISSKMERRAIDPHQQMKMRTAGFYLSGVNNTAIWEQFIEGAEERPTVYRSVFFIGDRLYPICAYARESKGDDVVNVASGARRSVVSESIKSKLNERSYRIFDSLRNKTGGRIENLVINASNVLGADSSEKSHLCEADRRAEVFLEAERGGYTVVSIDRPVNFHGSAQEYQTQVAEVLRMLNPRLTLLSDRMLYTTLFEGDWMLGTHDFVTRHVGCKLDWGDVTQPNHIINVDQSKPYPSQKLCEILLQS